MPATKPRPYSGLFVTSGVKQTTARSSAPVSRLGATAANSLSEVGKGRGESARPYFRKRAVMPIPPDNRNPEEIAAVALHPALQGHMHSPGIVACPNGDLLLTYFSGLASNLEYLPSVIFTIQRLRHGAQEWDWPEYFYSAQDVIEESPGMLHNNGAIWHITGGVSMHGVPFKWIESTDNGATWGQTRFPVLEGPLGAYDAQPINSHWRGADGTLYVTTDARGGSSALWASTDGGKTWRDTGGRTHGRHTTFAELADGRILGMGGKTSEYEGFMPRSLTADGGKTWEKLKTHFSPGAFNQRPSLLRLKSGRLFFACDAQPNRGASPMKERGTLVALSDDNGETWHIKTLAAAQIHDAHAHGKDTGKESGWHSAPEHHENTLGYSVATQSPDGVIHLVTSTNHPCLHFEMNEAWILEKDNQPQSPAPTAVGVSEKHVERHLNGNPRVTWSDASDSRGGLLLHGIETWHYEDGTPQYEVRYVSGLKTGTETYCYPSGKVKWTKEWQPAKGGTHPTGLTSTDRTMVWTQYWSNGNVKAQSRWRNNVAEGPAELWSPEGDLSASVAFRDGAASV
ncbi:MAG: hypothetical protein FJ319_09350 [SAR202 cluster bacterium]|nr:hypothetical protein [SAR202 cluster bacterium]